VCRSGAINAEIAYRRKVSPGAHRLGVHVERLVRDTPPPKGAGTGVSAYTLMSDGEPAGSVQPQLGFHNLISWSGLDEARQGITRDGLDYLILS
jgi:hypothetical protein